MIESETAVVENRLTLSNVTEYRRIPDTLDVEIISENPYIRLSERVDKDGNQNAEGTDRYLFAQNGNVYSGEGTDPLKYSEIPEWFWVLARKCNQEGRDRVGLVLPEEKEEYNRAKSAHDERKYDCPEKDCFASVPLYKKGVHIAQHALKKKRKATKKPAKKKIVKEKPAEQVLAGGEGDNGKDNT